MVSIYSDGPLGRAILRIHAHFLRFTWPIDPYLAWFRKALSPALDFPKGLSLAKEITKQDVVFECGVNLGELSRELAKCAKQVHSFEPNKRAFRHLEKIKIKNIEFHNIGISDKDQLLPFNTEYSFSGISSIYALENTPYDFRTLASFMSIDGAAKKFRATPTILIFDMEGAETDAMLGAKESMPYIRSVFCETHAIEGRGNTAEPMKKLLRDNGFRVSTGYDRGNSLWVIGRKY